MRFNVQEAIRIAGDSGYWYLATPYSRYGGGLDAAAYVASSIAGWLLRHGVPVFSPIAHSHAIASAAGLPHRDHGLWMPLDDRFMAPAVGLIVAELDGWESSDGVGIEIARFSRERRPVVYLSNSEIEVIGV